MLTQLLINNFAVVNSLDIELDSGFTAITGETGAGKSIMVDALSLILGDRADNSVIRDGEDKAEICAVFDISQSSKACQWLEERDLDAKECIIRRSLATDGRSRAFINDRPVTLSQMRELGESLLDIHSQHEHQSLMSKQTHRHLLDAYAEATELAQEVATSHQNWQSLLTQYNDLISSAQQQQDQQELIRFQLEELHCLNLMENELEALEQEQVTLANAEQILSTGQKVMALCGDDSSHDLSGGCLSLLSSAINQAQQLSIPQNQQSSSIELLQSAHIQIQEACDNLRQYLEHIEINPERQIQVEQRLSEAHQLARKHRIQPSELPVLCQQLEKEQGSMTNFDDTVAQLERDIETARKTYQKKSGQLSTAREKAAKSMSPKIITHLEAMGMKGSNFVARLTPLSEHEANAQGVENVEFLVSANPGQIPKPLQKVASGGELSRISLAIQVVLADKTNAATLIFDEVDVGIGGATAEVVGRLLRKLGTRGQVICVTHQPQVAAQANHHLAATKQTVNDFTDSRVTTLSADEKVMEVARMLGGLKLTDQTIAHATEMITNTQAN